MEKTIESLIDMLIKGGIKIIIALIVILVCFRLSKTVVSAVKKGKSLIK